MDIELSLDEIIERKRGPGGRPNDKKFHPGQQKPRKLLNKPAFKPGKPAALQTSPTQPPQPQRSFDARNKIIQKTRAKINDARDILNRNMRQSGIDARQLLLERKKERLPPLLPDEEDDDLPPVFHKVRRYSDEGGGGGGGGIHKGRFGQRVITMSNRPGALIQTLWDPQDSGPPRGGGGYKSSLPHQPYMPRLSQPPFAPRGYVDHDNMQDMEDEEISRTLHFGSYNSQPPPPSGPPSASRYKFGYGMEEMDDVEMSVAAPPSAMIKERIGGDPFAIYEASRNRIERPAPPPPNLVGHSDNVEKQFERRQRSLVATSNLPESLRARLFGNEPDRRVSQGIYANENGTGPSKLHGLGGGVVGVGRSPPPPPLGSANHKAGYRLLVSNLHGNVTTGDIRELFNDIGPMYDARVVRPGTAEVIYKTLEHAELAVDSYHQREFDGQPMHCVLVNPHSSNRPAMSASSRTVTTNSSGVEVDIDALHSVLFRDR